MSPATGAFTEGVGPGDGCSRAARVLERVVPHPKGFVLFTAKRELPPQPLGRRFVVRVNFVGHKKAKKVDLKIVQQKITQLISRHLGRKT